MFCAFSDRPLALKFAPTARGPADPKEKKRTGRADSLQAEMREHCGRFQGLRAPRLVGRAKCSFCGANGDQVEKLIVGGGKMQNGHPVMICDSCIDVCANRAPSIGVTATSPRSPLRKKLVVERIRSDQDCRTL